MSGAGLTDKMVSRHRPLFYIDVDVIIIFSYMFFQCYGYNVNGLSGTGGMMVARSSEASKMWIDCGRWSFSFERDGHRVFVLGGSDECVRGDDNVRWFKLADGVLSFLKMTTTKDEVATLFKSGVCIHDVNNMWLICEQFNLVSTVVE